MREIALMGVARNTRELRRRLRAKRTNRKLPPKHVTPPSPSGLWWFLDQLSGRERALVNYAHTPDDVVHSIRFLYSCHPKLAAEALQH